MSVLVIIKLSKFNSFVRVSKDLSLILMLFSIRGLPPFLGFFPKIWVFLGAPLIICPFLVISSVIIIFVYTSIMFSRVRRLKNVNSWRASFIVMVPMCLVM